MLATVLTMATVLMLAIVSASAVFGGSPAGASPNAAAGSATAAFQGEPDSGQPGAGNGTRIISRPNSGQRPTSPGDRGGSLQSLLFFGVMAGIVFLALLAYRDARRAQARRRTEEHAVARR